MICLILSQHGVNSSYITTNRHMFSLCVLPLEKINSYALESCATHVNCSLVFLFSSLWCIDINTYYKIKEVSEGGYTFVTNA